MSGFFTNFKPNINKRQAPYKSLKLRKKIQGTEFTDDPPLRKSSFLTDDESVSNEEIQKMADCNNYSTNIDMQKLTEIENMQDEEQNNKENEGELPDTVVDTICTRLSGMNMRHSDRKSHSDFIQRQPSKMSLPDTVVDDPALREIEMNLSSKKQLFMSEDSDDDLPLNQLRIKKEKQIARENIYEDDSNDDVIRVLDSDDEKEIDLLQPKSLDTSNSFINCSSSGAGTMNDFFNRPPPLESNLAVTHSMIQRFKNGEQVIQKEIEMNESVPMEYNEDECKEMNVTFRRSKKSFQLWKYESFNDNEHVEIGPTDESDIENDNIVDLTLDDSGPKSSKARLRDNDGLKFDAIPSDSISLDLPTSTKKNKEKKTQQNDTNKPKLKPTISKSIFVETPSRSNKKNGTNINIKFDLKICIRDGSASPELDTSSENSESDSSIKKSHLKAITESPFIERKSPDTSLTGETVVRKDGDNKIFKKNMDTLSEENFHTPNRQDEKPLIDEDLQSMLTSIYGHSWKTPKVLSSFKIKKYREELRKSLTANNFESFVGSLSKDLESTRISSPKSERPIRKNQIDNKFLKPIQHNKEETRSVKKTVSNKNLATPEVPAVKNRDVEKESDKNSNKKPDSAIKSRNEKLKTPINKITKTPSFSSVQRTPLHELCDTDESTSSDEDFNPDDTWNASSDEDYESEKDRIKKRQSIKHEPLIFTLDDSINEILKKYEFKPKPQMDSSCDKPIRRKLFTHSHYDDDQQVEPAKQEEPKKTPLKSPEIFTVPKNVVATPREIGKGSGKKELKSKEVKKTPSSAVNTPSSLIDNVCKKDMLKKFSTYSFLKSLDAEANKILCDPEALKFRENYKTKKNELAEKLFKLYNEKVFNLQLKNVPVKWNKKLLTTGGRCANSRRSGVRNSLIELSDKVLTSADRLRCTLIHEMCHAAAWILSGENGHGATWKKWTAKANCVFPELPKITVCHSYVIEYRYSYICTVCRARSQAHSKNKKVEDIRCSLCKGAIQLFENKKNAAGELELVPVEKKEPTAFAKFVKLKFKEVKKPHLNHKDVMQILSSQFSSLTVEEKAKL